MTHSGVVFELVHREHHDPTPCAAVEHTHTILDLVLGRSGEDETCGEPAPHSLVIDGEKYAACCTHYVEYIEGSRIN